MGSEMCIRDSLSTDKRAFVEDVHGVNRKPDSYGGSTVLRILNDALRDWGGNDDSTKDRVGLRFRRVT